MTVQPLDPTPDFWRVASDNLAIGYRSVGAAAVPVAVVQYTAPLTTQALRGVPLGSMAGNPQPWWPRFDQSQAPGPDELRDAWRASGRAKVTAAPVRSALRRQDGESPDSFYGRVADEYRLHAPTGKPAKWIAELGGVPVSTANRWIREARARGLLESTKEARAS